MDVAIGFDTSCYTTSVAAVDAGGRVIAFQRMLLPVQSGQRGLRQSEAVFAHIRQLPRLLGAFGDQLKTAQAKPVTVAASVTPTDLPDSYMPVFTVGESHARTLATVLDVPFWGVSHQQGHIAAGQLEQPPLSDRFLALHLSGGTTEMMLWDQGILSPLGGTLDLNAGQLIDRVGVALALPFPAGPSLEGLALRYPKPAEALIPANLANDDLNCHLSGAETRCQSWIAAGSMTGEAIAAEVFDLLARTVARMIAAGARKTGATQALLVGGVASSGLLRRKLAQRMEKLGERVELRFGKPEYSADNAAGVAWLGMNKLATQNGHALDKPSVGKA